MYSQQSHKKAKEILEMLSKSGLSLDDQLEVLRNAKARIKIAKQN